MVAFGIKEVFSDKLQFGNASSPSAGVTMGVTEPVKSDVPVDIMELYHTYKAGSLYFIDENNVLQGSGGVEHGQLGQGTQDYDKIRQWLAHSGRGITADYCERTTYLLEYGKR